MLTRLRIRNFKRFDDIDIELGKTVVLIGPNNSGKTTALQALGLWEAGVRRWNEKRKGRASPEQRPGVTINRRDLITVPVPSANLLWRDLHVRNVKQVVNTETGARKPRTKNICIEVIVDGVTNDNKWSCGLEFDYANEESFYCRPLRLTPEKHSARMEVPIEAGAVRVAFLPPMSGLAAVEPKWEAGRVNVLIGEGQTAQVLRNLCHQIYNDSKSNWEKLVHRIHELFGVNLMPPTYIEERGEITMKYEEANRVRLDLSSSGRGLQQTLLLLAHLYANPKTILLLDEPDAHLEILRQRQTYQTLTSIADELGSQIIAASHSEVVLNEAADRDVVIAFVGKPHRIDDRGSHVLKALKEIGFEDYYLAELKGWVLYVEGATDLAILKAFAELLEHTRAMGALQDVFVRYVGNVPKQAIAHFRGLREAYPRLMGVSLFDHLEHEPQTHLELRMLQWQKREIENYLCYPEVLTAYARHNLPDDLFGQAEADSRAKIMDELIRKRIPPIALENRTDRWWYNTKATDDFLDPLFQDYFNRLGLPNDMRKRDYHQLVRFMPRELIDHEVVTVLDAIAETARQATPRTD